MTSKNITSKEPVPLSSPRTTLIMFNLSLNIKFIAVRKKFISSRKSGFWNSNFGLKEMNFSI